MHTLWSVHSAKIINFPFISDQKKRKGKGKVALVIDGFGLDQIWQQIEHHTSGINAKLINNLTQMMGDEEFIKTIMETHSTSDELSQSDREEQNRPGKTLKG